MTHSRSACGAPHEGGAKGPVQAIPRHLLGAPARLVPDWRQLPPPSPALRASVILPVRNEAPRLRATLAALAAQQALDGSPFDRRCFEAIVLANNCTDRSAAVVRRFAAGQPGLALHVVEVQFTPTVAHVGHARACLMDEACRRLRGTAGGAGVIASTDGDTRIAPDWLATTLAEVAAGADAVGGRIVSEPHAGDPAGLLRLVKRDDTYQRLRARLEDLLDPDPADPWPRHHQHFGASLAVRVDAYERVGGCPPERYLEDEALFRKLRQHDLRVRHSDRVRVLTSGRRRGRVEVGLSQQLREWAALAAADGDPLVPDPAAWARLLTLRRQLRQRWLKGAADPSQRPAWDAHWLAGLPLHLDIAPHGLRAAWHASATFGAVWAPIEAFAGEQQRLNGAAQPMPMRRAITQLRRLIAAAAVSGVSRPGPAGTSAAASR